MFHRTKRFFRHIWIGWRSFRDARHPIPFKPHKPEMLADVPGDTVFYVVPADDTCPATLSKGIIYKARIEENGSLSYDIHGDTTFFGPAKWHPAHLCCHEEGYKEFLVRLLEEHGYKPLKFEHIAQAMKMVVSKGLWEDLVGPPDALKEEPTDVISE